MDRKNTLLLTVIAVATLLVAVIGATFAYFTAQATGNKETPITVTTNSTDSTTFHEGEEITITADMSNFALSDVGDEREEKTYGESSPYVSFKKSDMAGNSSTCYTVKLVVNDAETKAFQVSTANKESKPELVLHVEKQPGSEADNGTTSSQEITAIDGLTHKTEIGEENDRKKVDGFDITTANNKTYNIPTLASQGSDKKYVHKLEASTTTEVKDTWKFSVYMINYNFDQKENAGKSFTANIVFESADCSGA